MSGVLIVTAVASALILVRAGTPGTRPAGARPWGRRSPAAGLVAVIVLIYLNQVLVTIYVLRVHGGDPSFIGVCAGLDRRGTPDAVYPSSR